MLHFHGKNTKRYNLFVNFPLFFLWHYQRAPIIFSCVFIPVELKKHTTFIPGFFLFVCFAYPVNQRGFKMLCRYAISHPYLCYDLLLPTSSTFLVSIWIFSSWWLSLLKAMHYSYMKIKRKTSHSQLNFCLMDMLDRNLGVCSWSLRSLCHTMLFVDELPIYIVRSIMLPNKFFVLMWGY